MFFRFVPHGSLFVLAKYFCCNYQFIKQACIVLGSTNFASVLDTPVRLVCLRFVSEVTRVPGYLHTPDCTGEWYWWCHYETQVAYRHGLHEPHATIVMLRTYCLPNNRLRPDENTSHRQKHFPSLAGTYLGIKTRTEVPMILRLLFRKIQLASAVDRFSLPPTIHSFFHYSRIARFPALSSRLSVQRP